MKKDTIKVLENMKCHLKIADLMRIMGKNPIRKELKKDIHWAHRVIHENIKAKAVVGFFPIEKINDEKIHVKRLDQKAGVSFNIGDKANLLFQARKVQISALSLGSKIDDIRKESQKTGKNLRAYVLDTAGIVALKYLGQTVNQIAEKEAEKLGWGLGYRMSPGSLQGWSLKDQHLLCNLLPIEAIGVKLSHSSMLIPLKSATALIGMGPEYSSSLVKSACKWCRYKSDCISI